MNTISGTTVGLQPGSNSPTFTTNADLNGDSTFSNLFQQARRTVLKEGQDATVENQQVEIGQSTGDDAPASTREQTVDVSESFTRSTEFANGDIELLEADTEGSFAASGEDSNINVNTGINPALTSGQDNSARALSRNVSTSSTESTRIVRSSNGETTTTRSSDIQQSSEEKFDDKIVLTDFEKSTSATDTNFGNSTAQDKKPAADPKIAETKPIPGGPIRIEEPLPKAPAEPKKPAEPKAPAQEIIDLPKQQPLNDAIFPEGPLQTVETPLSRRIQELEAAGVDTGPLIASGEINDFKLPGEKDTKAPAESKKPAEPKGPAQPFTFASGSGSEVTSTTNTIVLGQNSNSFESGTSSISNSAQDANKQANSIFQSLLAQYGFSF